MNSQVQVLIRSRADEERTPTHYSIIIGLRLNFITSFSAAASINHDGL